MTVEEILNSSSLSVYPILYLSISNVSSDGGIPKIIRFGSGASLI